MWAAFSATLKHPDGRRDAQRALGFTKAKFHDVMLSTDRADIKYVNRFARNPTTGVDFADFAYLISDKLTRTMIAVETIEKATRFINWLDRNLPDDLPERDLVVQPFHSLISAEDRNSILENLVLGRTWYIVATLAANVGLDIVVDIVIVMDLPKSFETLMQWAGRASRSGAGGTFIAYAPDAFRIETVFDQDGDPTQKKRAMSQKKLEDRKKRRDQEDKVMIDYFNPPHGKCPRDVACEYFGEILTAKPEQCCEHKTCQPDESRRWEEATKAYLASMARESAPLHASKLPKFEMDYAAIDEAGRDEALIELRQWHFNAWNARKLGPIFGKNIIASDADLHKIATQLHQMSTHERFEGTQQGSASYEDLLPKERGDLWALVRELNERFAGIAADKLQRKARTNAKKRVVQGSQERPRQPKKQDNAVEEDDVHVSDILTRRSQAGRQIRLSEKARAQLDALGLANLDSTAAIVDGGGSDDNANQSGDSEEYID